MTLSFDNCTLRTDDRNVNPVRRIKDVLVVIHVDLPLRYAIANWAC